MPRDAFNKTQSPGLKSPSLAAEASAASAKHITRDAARPAFTASSAK